MGKGHKDRRREKRAHELEDREKDIQSLKEELQEETEKIRSTKKPIETSSDTDSGHGASITTADSPKIIHENGTEENTKRRTLVKGLINIGNTCFFNVIIQSLAHTPLLMDSMYRTICILMQENGRTYSSTTTAQLIRIFDEFTSEERKKNSIDPKPLFNSLIQKIPSYKGYDQHDSHELFMNLMLILRAEEIQLKNLKFTPSVNINTDDDPSKMFCLIGCSEPYTSYDSIFGGHLLDVISCKKCGKSLMKIEPFLGLLLPLTDRMSPAENYRSRRKREDHTRNKPKKEPKPLSRKQQKALEKREKKNQRQSTGSGKIRGRQAAKKRPVQEQLPLEEPSSVNSTEETSAINEPNEIKETAEEKADNPLLEEKEEEKEDEEEEQAATEKTEEEPPAEENGDNIDNDDDEDEEQQQPKGPLTAVQSTCILADLVSKLTLIHETTSRPLPFVDENIAQTFLSCPKSSNASTENSETDDIKALNQCFQRYFKPEVLSGENSFDCYYCRSLDQTQKKVLTEATRQTVFFQLPPILPVFLKRFQTYGSHSEKINKFIQFPVRLDLTDRCSSQAISTSPIYSLYAVIEHSGTLRSGHYVAYIKQSFSDNDLTEKNYSKPIDRLFDDLFHPSTDEKDPIENKNVNGTDDPSTPPTSWYYISDNSVHKVPESKVLEADAYVLFYRRM